jgi:predicted nucleic acid-binding protein
VSSSRVVVDSSGWIEVFTDGPSAGVFLQVMEDEDRLVVPSITIFEVFKWILREHSEADAIQASAVMQRGLVVQLDPMAAIAAAQLSHALRLPMSDSVVLTTAR